MILSQRDLIVMNKWPELKGQVTSNDQGIKFGHQQNCQVGPHSPWCFFPLLIELKSFKMITNHLLGESHHVTYVMEKKDKTKQLPKVQVGAFFGDFFFFHPPKKTKPWCFYHFRTLEVGETVTCCAPTGPFSRTWGACKPCAFFYQEGCSNKVRIFFFSPSVGCFQQTWEPKGTPPMPPPPRNKALHLNQ